VAIIDPSLGGADRTTQIEQLMISYPSLPIIAYVPLTPQAFSMVSALSKSRLRHSVLYSHDDGDAAFLSMINRVSASPLTGRVLERLRPQLEMLPLSLTKAVEQMFAEPHGFPKAQQLSTNSNIPLVKVYRAFQEAGLGSPKKVFMAAKLLKGFTYLGDPANSVVSVGKKLGYRHARIFADHCSELFGLNPSRLRAYMTEDQAIEKVVSAVLSSDSTTEIFDDEITAQA
jgi:AraC-like DNA-binding protein